MARKDRSDQTVAAHEQKHGLPKGTIRNQDGSKPKPDKQIGSLRKEGKKK